MPLLDHFHPPLSGERQWESFHAAWAGSIADLLNRDLLPGRYFAEEHVHMGSRVEINVATFDDEAIPEELRGATSIAQAVKAYTAPAPVLVWPAVFPDSLEVLVFNREAGPSLVAAIELVSPANKDRAETRRAFVAKCTSYLQQGVGLMVVDIVTSRFFNLHEELAVFLGQSEAAASTDRLYAVSYRPHRHEDDGLIDIWIHALAVGQPLPTLPLALDKGLILPLDLELVYTHACDRRRISRYPRPVG